mmetsp:Transcript_3588/g.4742  ORF Transcript_3588/g.4742 Transcript_3588/m.4742 type:complete len:82 (-) Transcript_3588:739-984(-)
MTENNDNIISNEIAILVIVSAILALLPVCITCYVQHYDDITNHDIFYYGHERRIISTYENLIRDKIIETRKEEQVQKVKYD